MNHWFPYESYKGISWISIEQLKDGRYHWCLLLSSSMSLSLFPPDFLIESAESFVLLPTRSNKGIYWKRDYQDRIPMCLILVISEWCNNTKVEMITRVLSELTHLPYWTSKELWTRHTTTIAVPYDKDSYNCNIQNSLELEFNCNNNCHCNYIYWKIPGWRQVTFAAVPLWSSKLRGAGGHAARKMAWNMLVQRENWLVVWLPFFIFPYIGNNHPNWLSYFSEGWPNHQPDAASKRKDSGKLHVEKNNVLISGKFCSKGSHKKGYSFGHFIVSARWCEWLLTGITRWCPPSYQLVYNPNNYRYNPHKP